MTDSRRGSWGSPWIDHELPVTSLRIQIMTHERTQEQRNKSECTTSTRNDHVHIEHIMEVLLIK